MQWGDTILITAQFRDFYGNPVDVQDVQVRFFAREGEEITVTKELEKIGVGKWQVRVELPDGYSVIVHEWTGMIDGNKVTRRGKITANWVD